MLERKEGSLLGESGTDSPDTRLHRISGGGGFDDEEVLPAGAEGRL